MYLNTLLLLYIILSHIYFYKIWRGLFGTYKELQNKYDSKQWVCGIMSDILCGRLFGYSTKRYKYKYIAN